jgi:hypothetical protein
MIARFAQRECCAANLFSIGIEPYPGVRAQELRSGLDEHCVDACQGGLRSQLWPVRSMRLTVCKPVSDAEAAANSAVVSVSTSSLTISHP